MILRSDTRDRARLCRLAIRATLNTYSSVEDAVRGMGFVQIDPIRAPATAQDLILRHRVKGYRAGDVDAAYPQAALEEDLVYAHGFITRDTWRLLHPRLPMEATPLDAQVHALVRAQGALDSRGVDAFIASEVERNAWGGESKATQLALERLHRAGSLRIARRERGRRLYEVAGEHGQEPTERRVRQLALLLVRVLGPVRERRLRANLSRMAKKFGGIATGVVDELRSDGEIVADELAGERYLSLPGIPDDPAPRRVRLLAPFDPLVHDRERTLALFDFDYRFEAYTPKARRVRGYYALPVLYGAALVGHANAQRAGGSLEFDVTLERDVDARFHGALRAELARLAHSLRVTNGDAVHHLHHVTNGDAVHHPHQSPD